MAKTKLHTPPPEDAAPATGTHRKSSQVRLKRQGSASVAAFERALRAVRDNPSDFEAWDTLEALCEDLERPEEVADAYLRMLTPSLDARHREQLSRRAADFHDSWLGDDPEAMQRVLARVLEVLPACSWALERLVTVLTVSERWEPLLDTYDGALRSEQDGTRRRALLQDAAHVAKDFAESPERAVDYVRQLLLLDRDAGPLAASVERMLQQGGRWGKLIELWQAQLEAGAVEDVAAHRLRIAALHFEQLSDPESALREAARVLRDRPGHAQACELVERVLAHDSAPRPLRLEALSLLRRHHDSADRPDDFIRVLELALGFAPEGQQLELRRELAARLMRRERDLRAIEHFGEVLRWAPDDAHARAQLAQLAERAGAHAGHAAVLERAAEAATDQALKAQLLLSAMAVHAERLGAPEAAIALGQRVLELTQLPAPRLLEAARATDALLAATERREERSAVLEQRVLLEPDRATRRQLLVEVARLSLELDAPERALRAWEQWLQEDAADLEALAASIELSERLEMPSEQVRFLDQRAQVAPTQRQRRQDLVRAAELTERQLHDDSAAIERWSAILGEFGDEEDALTALDRLLARTSRFAELASILEDTTGRERGLSLARLQRLGDIQRSQLGEPTQAAQAYARALELDPGFEPARAGLAALLEAPAPPASAVRALAQAYAATDDWQLRLGLLEARLAAAEDTDEQRALLMEAAAVAEQRGRDLSQAQALVGRALILAPAQTHAERELLRLAEATGDLQQAADVMAEAAAAAAPADAQRAAALRAHEAALRERLEDPERAAEAFGAVLDVHPDALPAAHGLVRNAAACGRWDVAARAALSSARARRALERDALEALEQAAERTAAFDALTERFGAALDEVAEQLPPELARALYTQLYHWHLERREDPEAAEQAIRRALAHGPDYLPALHLLADAQRLRPSRELVETLRRIDQHDTDGVDALREAAEVCLVHGDEALKRAVLSELIRRAARHWTEGGGDVGGRSPAQLTHWAVDQLVELELDTGHSARAIQILDDAARLPFTEEERAALRLRSARAHERAGELVDALAKGRDALVSRPDDLALVRWLASLAERLERTSELLALRRAELELVRDEAERKPLRLEIARLCGVLEGRDDRLRMLARNLEESPGHVASIEALCDLLGSKHRHRELAELLTAQAQALAEAGVAEQAAELFRRVARLADGPLRDLPQAVDSYERAAALVPDVETLDTLIERCAALEDPGRQARWLAVRLEHGQAEDRPRLLLSLARAQLGAAQVERALDTLQTAFDERPHDVEVRRLLTEQLRAVGREAQLASVLGKAAMYTEDPSQAVALARESAQLHGQGLQSPEQLVEVVDHALRFVPGDRELRRLRAQGLRVLGRLDDARRELEGLLEELGRRRSPERASVHLSLAEVLRDLGQLSAACAQLESALSMRPGDVQVMHLLAELGVEAGELQRAERALHALLLAARRGQVRLASGQALCVSEVLLQLRQIALARGDTSQASSLLESALEQLPSDPEECARIKGALRVGGERDVLEQVLRAQLEGAGSAYARATYLDELAALLARDEARVDEALALRLEAVEADPRSPDLQAAAHALSVERDQEADYVALLERLLARSRPPTDAYERCEMHLRLGQIMESRGDRDAALEHYAQAEAAGVREADVWRAQLRLASERADSAEQERLLACLTQLGEAEFSEEGRADVLYRLAEIRLSDPETSAEGAELLREALREAALPARAARLLARALIAQPGEAALMSLFSEVARDCPLDDLAHVVHQCAERADEPALGALLECLEATEGTEALRRAISLSRARRLLDSGDPASARRGATLLRDALRHRPLDREAEARLIEYYTQAEPEALVDYLEEQLAAAEEPEEVARYALSISSARGASASRARRALRRALGAAPGHAELRCALLAHLNDDAHRLERATLLMDALRGDSVRDAARLAHESFELFRAEEQPERALEALELGRRHAPDDEALLELLADTYRAREDVPALVQLLVDATERKETAAARVEGWREIARLRGEALGDPAGAAEALANALALAPEDGALSRSLAQAQLAAGDKSAAADTLGRAIERAEADADRAELLHLRGRLYVELGERDRGLEDLVRAFELAPKAVGADLMRLLEEERCAARKQGQSARERQALLRLVDIHRVRGRYDQAAKLVQQWAADHEDDVEALRTLGTLYQASGRLEDQAAVCVALVTKEAGEAQATAAGALVGLLDAMSDTLPARKALEKAYADQPDSAAIRGALRALYEHVGERRGLARLLLADAHAAKDLAARAGFMREAAKQLLDGGSTSEAIAVLKRVLEGFPEDVETTTTLAQAQLSVGRAAQARALLTRAVDAQPEGALQARAQLLRQLSQACRAEGDGEAALRALHAARDADPGNRQLLAELAVLAEELEQWELAEKVLTSVLLLKDDKAMPKAEALLRRTRVAVHRGSPQRALLWARKALDADPSSEEARRLVATLSQRRAR